MGSFSITSDTADDARGGQISVNSGVKLDHEAESSYMVTVTATDPDNLSASIDVTISVTDVDEAPVVSGDAKKDYAENGTGAVATFTADDPEDRKVYWSVHPAGTEADLNNDGDVLDPGEGMDDNPSADAAHFSINADGVLTFNIPPDHESPHVDGGSNVYNIVVVASDDAPGADDTNNPTQMGYKKVVVTVTDEDERGMVTLSSRQPQVGVALTATLNAPEQSTTDIDITWMWEKSTNRSSGWSAIDQGADEQAYTPVDTTNRNYLRVTATYDDADGEERTAQAVTAMSVRTAPAITDADASFPSGPNANDRNVDENSSAGANVGKPVAASDTQDDVLTYSLTGANTGGFEIDSETGQITVGPRTMLNHEETSSYNDVTVTVTEASGDPTAIEVTIMVNDVNEAPMVTGGVTALKLVEYDADTDVDGAVAEATRAKMVSTYMALDPEEDTATWTLEGTDRDLFDITTVGALTFDDAPSYEAPADAGKDNTYNVTVVATDVGTGKGEKMTAKRRSGHHGHRRGGGWDSYPVCAGAEDRSSADGQKSPTLTKM